MSTIIIIIAIILGIIGIFMAWIASRKNGDLSRRIERANERITALQTEAKTAQQKIDQEKAALRSELNNLTGTPVAKTTRAVDVAPPSPPQPMVINEITPEALKRRIEANEDLIIVDMRQLFEYKSGHIPGAVNIFVNDVPAQAETLPKDKDIVFQCWSGNTSRQASAYLLENGWSPERVASLSGGIAGWTQTYGMESLIQG